MRQLGNNHSSPDLKPYLDQWSVWVVSNYRGHHSRNKPGVGYTTQADQCTDNIDAAQGQAAVTAHLKSKQLLLFVFALHQQLDYQST